MWPSCLKILPHLAATLRDEFEHQLSKRLKRETILNTFELLPENKCQNIM